MLDNMFFGRRQKLQLNNAEATYKVHYLGNVMTSLVKGGYHHGKTHEANLSASCTESNESRFLNLSDAQIIRRAATTEDSVDHSPVENNLNKKFNNIVCNVDKPVKILWDNHLKHNGHAGLKMKLTLTQGGLRVNTKDHGLTEYYGHRIHFLQAHPLHPKLFVWVYQHVGKNLKSEIRCHAVLCERARDSRLIESLLTMRLQQTFLEYKREKRRQQNSRLCNSKNGGLLAGQVGTRKRAFTKSTKNYKPPVQHGMCSAPKLDDVLEEEEEDMFEESAIDDTVDNTENSWHHQQECSNTNINEINISEDEDIDRLNESFEDLKEEENEEADELDELNSEESGEKSSSNQEDEFTYENIIAQIKKNGCDSAELDSESVEKIYNEENDLNCNQSDNNQIKLPLSSSSSSASITSSAESQKLTDDIFDESKKITDLNSGSPIFISSCSAASSISSSTSEPTISPCSITSEKSFNQSDSDPSRNLSNDSGVCTKSTTSVHISETQKFKLANDETSNGFNQVSYEFLSDLSEVLSTNQTVKPILVNGSSRFRDKFMPQSRSFNVKNSSLIRKSTPPVNSNKTEAITTGSTNESSSETNNFYNPFNRSTISKSFSAFTSRLKQQQQLQKVPFESQKPAGKTLKFNDLVVEIESKTDEMSLMSSSDSEKKPIVNKNNSHKKMAPPPPTTTPHAPSTSFIKCYNHASNKKADIFYVNNKSNPIANQIKSDNQQKVVRLIKKSSQCSNSPLSSPELSTCSESSYSTHSTTDQTNKETESAQLIISL